MRHPISLALCLIGAATLCACGTGGQSDADAKRAIDSVNVIDESNLNDLLLTSGDPAEAVAYFSNASAEQPERLDLKRGLAKSLVRAKQPTQAIAVWSQIVAAPDATNDDRIGLTDSLIRANEWGRAEQQLNQIPPTFESFDRYRLEAMVADSKKDWKKADSFYEIATGLTATPANVLNNWGFSKLSRGDYAGSERLFGEALTYDSTLFTAKNNLVLARGAQRKYDLPVIPMTQTERAELLYTLGLAAVKHGDITVGKGLLQDAVETHPQHFEAAARSLAALGG